MKRDFVYILIILLLSISLFVMWDYYRDSGISKDSIKSMWEADKVIHEKQISLRDSFVLAQEAQIKIDSANHAKTQGLLRSEIKRLKGRVLIPSNSGELEVADYPCRDQLVLRDSIITAQDSLISDMTVEKDSMRLNFAEITDSLKANEADLKAQIKLADSIISLPVPKQSRVSLSLSTGYGLMSSGGVVRSGVFFGPSMSYRLPTENISLRKLFRRK